MDVVYLGPVAEGIDKGGKVMDEYEAKTQGVHREIARDQMDDLEAENQRLRAALEAAPVPWATWNPDQMEVWEDQGAGQALHRRGAESRVCADGERAGSGDYWCAVGVDMRDDD